MSNANPKLLNVRKRLMEKIIITVLLIADLSTGVGGIEAFTPNSSAFTPLGFKFDATASHC